MYIDFGKIIINMINNIFFDVGKIMNIYKSFYTKQINNKKKTNKNWKQPLRVKFCKCIDIQHVRSTFENVKKQFLGKKRISICQNFNK